MTHKTVLAAWACLLLVSQLQALTPLAPTQSLDSAATLHKRSSWRWWWSWSTPGRSSSGSKVSPDDSYGGGSARPSPADSYGGGSARPKPADSYGGGSARPKPAYTGPHIPTSGSDIQQWLHHHNKFRAQYSAGPLKWNPELVAASKRLTDTCVWEHTQNNPFGENMSAGQQSIEEVVTGWVTGPDEKDSYTGGNTEPSHFTQVVWLSTTEVGCYKGMCRDVRGANLPQSPQTFWACNYNPPGNIIGEIDKNVKAAPGGRPL